MDDRIAALGLVEDEAIALDLAALDLAALDHPGISLAPYRDLLGVMVERLIVAGREAGSATARAEALARVIGGEYRFTGDRETYDDPANADLVRVMDRRRGLPVSLAILYVAAARRLGWGADALNLPGHVLIRIEGEDGVVLADPFDGGAVVDQERLAGLPQLRAVTGPLPVDQWPAMTNRAILVRLLFNQASRAEAGGDTVRALALFERMTTVAPLHGEAWWNRARFEIEQDDRAGARSSLSAMLEVTRQPDVREHVIAALDALSG